MRILLLFVLASGCPTKANPKYCDTARPCPAPATCDLVRHDCSGPPVDMAAPADLAEAPDLGEPSDMTPTPDLNEPDLIPPADLMPPPDLEPPPVYFNPDVQTILNVGGNGGCARGGCHNASDALYVPLLAPDPSTSVGFHANYLSFSAEPSATVFLKLVKNSGTAHGGTMTSVDRKPCATMSAEPCATLSRWYAAGMPEVAP